MHSLSNLFDPSFHAFAQTILDTASLDVRAWAQLARVSHDMRYCVNHALARATRAHIEGLLRLFLDDPNGVIRMDVRDAPRIHGELVWARDWNGTATSSRRLVRIGYHIYKDANDPCHTLVALTPDELTHSFCMHHSFIHVPILNPGLELAVARMALIEGAERMPKRRKCE